MAWCQENEAASSHATWAWSLRGEETHKGRGRDRRHVWWRRKLDDSTSARRSRPRCALVVTTRRRGRFFSGELDAIDSIEGATNWFAARAPTNRRPMKSTRPTSAKRFSNASTRDA